MNLKRLIIFLSFFLAVNSATFPGLITLKPRLEKNDINQLNQLVKPTNKITKAKRKITEISQSSDEDLLSFIAARITKSSKKVNSKNHVKVNNKLEDFKTS